MVELLFYFFATLLVFSSLMVVSSGNPVHSVLFLILGFFNAAGLFILLDAEFLAMTLVIVYVGAVAVLFLFVVMMLNIEAVISKKQFLSTLPIGLLMALVLAVILYSSYNHAAFPIGVSDIGQSVTNTEAIGHVLYTAHFVPFQTVGLILLVAMIGAIVLTMLHAPAVRRQDIQKQLDRDPQKAASLVDVKSRQGVKL